ncbi:PTS system cellobiose-specific IIA component [Streptococcus rupicaprae]|uniref:PTS system cellobiose-specific IIA component n=1 Tax=Streptococcus rupicaprae TaxID=759619 RepID=A0ABV2FF77_9STRE
MTEETPLLEVIMQLIMYGGDAKSKAMEAIHLAKQAQFESAQAKIAEANASLSQAHHAQTGLLTKEASGEHIQASLLMIHGQDHLMNAITFIDLAKEVIALYQEMQELKEASHEA